MMPPLSVSDPVPCLRRYLDVRISTLLATAACSRPPAQQVYAVAAHDVSWQDGEDSQQTLLGDAFQSGDEQLAIEFRSTASNNSGEGGTVSLWRAFKSGSEIELDDRVASSFDGWRGELGSGQFYVDTYFSIDSIELGGLTMLTPNGIWLEATQFDFMTDAQMTFDPQEALEPGELLADAFLDAVFGSSSVTIETSEPVDVSEIGFRIEHGLKFLSETE